MYPKNETGAGCGLMEPITRRKAEDCPVFHVDADVHIARTGTDARPCAPGLRVSPAPGAHVRRSLPRECGRTSYAADLQTAC
jgi:hypothetical protein